MKKYIKPTMELVEICTEEVIAASMRIDEPQGDVTASGKSRNDFFDFDEPSSSDLGTLF